MFSPAIHLKKWGKHFEHEHIIKSSKNLIDPERLMNDPNSL